MEQLFVLQLFQLIFRPLVKLIGYIFCLPQLILKRPKLSILKEYKCDNILQIIFTCLFLILYNSIYLNFHILYIFRYYSLIESKFELFIAFLILYSFAATFYKAEDIKYFIGQDLLFMLVLAYNIFLYIFTFFSIFIRWDKQSINILFDNNYNIGFSNYKHLSIIDSNYIGDTIILGILKVLIILHVINPLSWLRIYGLVFHDNALIYSKRIILSTLLIIHDFICIFAYLVNIPFLIQFLKLNLKIFFAALTYKGSDLAYVANTSDSYQYYLRPIPQLEDFLSKRYYGKYNYICFYLIWDSFLANYQFLFDFIKKYIKPILFSGKIFKLIFFIFKFILMLSFSGINIIFIWRYKEMIRNLRIFREDYNIINFIKNSLGQNISGIRDIIFTAAFLLNRIIFINNSFLDFYAKNIIQFMKEHKACMFKAKPELFEVFTKENSFSLFSCFFENEKGFFQAFYSLEYELITTVNLQVFAVKTFDLLITILSLVNLLSPIFYIKLYYYYRYTDKNSKKEKNEKIEKTEKYKKMLSYGINNLYLFPLFSTEYQNKLANSLFKDLSLEICNEVQKRDIQNNFSYYIVKINSNTISLVRDIVFKNVLNDLIFGFFLVGNLVTILDPFSGLMHVFNILKFFGKIKLSFTINNQNNKNLEFDNTNTNSYTNLKMSSIVKEEISIAINLLFHALENILINIPLTLISIMLFPLNIIKVFIFCAENYYVFFYRKIKENYLLNSRLHNDLNFNTGIKEYIKFTSEAVMEIEYLNQFKKHNFIKSIFKRVLKGWSTLIKFVLINISFLRGIHLYYDLISLKRFFDFFKSFTAGITSTKEFMGYINFIHKNNDIKSMYDENENKTNEKDLNKNFAKESCDLFIGNNLLNTYLLRKLNSISNFFSKKYIFIFYDQEAWLDFFNNNNYNNDILLINENDKFSNKTLKKGELVKIDFNCLKKIINENINVIFYLENVIDDNFNQLLKEFIFYPIILFIFITNPLIFYLGYIKINSNDYNIFRQRKFEYKAKICGMFIFEYFIMLLNLIKIFFLILTIVKIPDLVQILYYHTKAAIFDYLNKESDTNTLLTENFEGEFSKDLNQILIQALNFYLILILILINVILILRIPSVFRRVSRFIVRYYINIKFKYLTKKISTKNSVVEKLKINCFISICEYLSPKDLGSLMLTNKKINKFFEKKLLWNNFFESFYLKKINAFLKYTKLAKFEVDINNLVNLIENAYLVNEGEESSSRIEKQNKKLNAEKELQKLMDEFNDKGYEKLKLEFSDKNHEEKELRIIIEEYETKSFEGKTICEKAQNCFDTNSTLEIPEKLRDKFIGITNVLIEETIESIFKFPHILLIPCKIISIPIILISHALFWLFTKTLTDENRSQQVIGDNDIHRNIVDNKLFYNIQLLGIYSIVKIIYVIIYILLKIIDKAFRVIFEILTLKPLLNTNIKIKFNIYSNNYLIERKSQRNENPLWETIQIEEMYLSEFLSFLLVHFVSFIIFLFHIFIILLPTFYFKYEGLNKIFHTAFFDDHRMENHVIYKQGKSPFLSGLNWWIFIEEIFNAVWKLSLSNKIRLFYGNYFLNIASFLLSVIIYVVNETRLSADESLNYPFYTIINNWTIRFLRYIFRLKNLVYIIYPNILIFDLYIFFGRRFKILNNKILMNIFGSILVLFPFYLNFKVKLTLFRFILINAYGLTNWGVFEGSRRTAV